MCKLLRLFDIVESQFITDRNTFPGKGRGDDFKNAGGGLHLTSSLIERISFSLRTYWGKLQVLALNVSVLCFLIKDT